MTATPAARPTGRRRRPGLRALVVLLVLVALVVGADRVAAWAVGRGTAEGLTAEGDDVVGAEVTIHGFPFLTQLAAGSLDRVTGSLDAGTFAGYRVSDVRFTASDVAPDAPYRARHARADGLLDYASVQSAVAQEVGSEVTLGPAPDDAAGAVGITLPVLGFDVTATAVPRVVDAGTLTVDVQSVTLAGATIDVADLPDALGRRLSDVRVPLELPEGLELRTVEVRPDGLRVGLEARDVALGALATS